MFIYYVDFLCLPLITACPYFAFFAFTVTFTVSLTPLMAYTYTLQLPGAFALIFPAAFTVAISCFSAADRMLCLYTGPVCFIPSP